MNANDKKTKKSKAVGYGTFGRSVLASNPKNVIVNTVVIPKLKKKTNKLFNY